MRHEFDAEEAQAWLEALEPMRGAFYLCDVHYHFMNGMVTWEPPQLGSYPAVWEFDDDEMSGSFFTPLVDVAFSLN